MSNQRNINECYRIFGLSVEASLEEIKQAHKVLAMAWHPDCFPKTSQQQEITNSRFQEINEAYEVLASYYQSLGGNSLPQTWKCVHTFTSHGWLWAAVHCGAY